MEARLGSLLRERQSSWGACLVSIERTGSTNTECFALGRAGAPEGTLVLAERQERGKGRWNRPWESVSGGLYLSILLRPQSRRSPLTLLPLLVAVSVAEAAHELTGVRIRLRWPNDLYVAGRKLGGILCESSLIGSRTEFTVAGIGVNVNQTQEDFTSPLAEEATSLRLASGHSWEPALLADAIIGRLEQQYHLDDAAEVLERWKASSEGAGDAPIRFVTREGESKAAVTGGIADDGGLRVRLDDGSVRILYSEDVVMVRGR
ncbi:MAG TPA: biotin--[acetyl-CoA-carboxylase] ligase [Vicinamibacteria bacterium]|nr:biotin--[acetyl-CoA-carboxylase] ligase [Vicinamibacteria bacterium]